MATALEVLCRQGLLREADRLGDPGALRKAFPQDGRLIKALFRHGILVSGETTPSVLVPGPAEGLTQQTHGMSLYLLLSQSCNLGCVYCLNGRRTYRTQSNRKMGEDVAFRAVERCLERIQPEGHLEVVFFGGEPLLNWPLVEGVIHHCEQMLKPKAEDKRIRYHITSNLTKMPSQLVRVARKHRVSVLCDIDGPGEIHDLCRPFKDGRPSHAVTAGHVRQLVQEGVDVSLRATLTRLNQDRLVDIALHHRELGGRGCGLVPVNPVNSDEELLDARLLPDVDALMEGLQELYESGLWSSQRLFPFSAYSHKVVPGNRAVLGCGAPYGNTPVVDADGDVYPCIYLVGMEQFRLGNVVRGDFPNKALIQSMMETLHVDHLDECRSCAWRYVCGGGCPVLRLTVFNHPRLNDAVARYSRRINCDYTKKVLELLFWELADEASTLSRSATAEDPTVGLDPSQTVHC